MNQKNKYRYLKGRFEAVYKRLQKLVNNLREKEEEINQIKKEHTKQIDNIFEIACSDCVERFIIKLNT